MTEEEKQLIQGCRIVVIGSANFISYLRSELEGLGFGKILNISKVEEFRSDNTAGILIEYTGSGFSQPGNLTGIPVIYPFDFIDGAAVIVVFPDDDMEFQYRPNLRMWAAEYIAGYCAFWHIEDCNWLCEVLPAIKEDTTSEPAQKTAACMAAKTAANIAVGRNIKRYPRFYLCRNLK